MSLRRGPAVSAAGTRADPRVQRPADHAEHRRGGRGLASHGSGVCRTGVGPAVDVRQEAEGRRGECRRRKSWLRLRGRTVHAARHAASRDRSAMDPRDRQRASGHGSRVRRLQVLRGLPHESGHARPGVVRRPRETAEHLCPTGRGRDFGRQHGDWGGSHGRASDVRHVGGGASP